MTTSAPERNRMVAMPEINFNDPAASWEPGVVGSAVGFDMSGTLKFRLNI